MIYKHKIDREIFELSDGGNLALDWILCQETTNNQKTVNSSNKPLLAVIPGVTGDASKLYMISIIQESFKNGYDVVVINYRGLAGVPLKVRICFDLKY